MQGADLDEVLSAVEKAGGEVTHELRIIRAAGVRLTVEQRELLEADPAITKIWADRAVETDSTTL